MELFDLVHEQVTGYLSNPLISISGTLLLIYLLFQRTKLFIFFVFVAAAGAVFVHVASKLVSLGLDNRLSAYLQ